MGKTNSMRDALIAAGVTPGRRRQRFDSYREYFANTDVGAELAATNMPDSKKVWIGDFKSTEQLVDFLNLTRHRLNRANFDNNLQREYIQLLESQMVRNGLTLPRGRENNTGAKDETESNQPS